MEVLFNPVNGIEHRVLILKKEKEKGVFPLGLNLKEVWERQKMLVAR